MSVQSIFPYEASNGATYVIETYYSNEVMGCALIDGEHVIEGCKDFDEAMNRAIRHIEKEIAS